MMKGDDVYNAQKLLNDKGYSCGTADGVFGRKTEIATKNFQIDNGLTSDGIIGKKTAEKLGFKWEG
jgi:peptidoglycan hydrolase-like protein with peptidoglycan-binding domain